MSARRRVGMGAARQAMRDRKTDEITDAPTQTPAAVDALPEPRQPAAPIEPAATTAPATRPQPFTPDLVPDPPMTPRPADDASPLSAEEQAEFAACGRALQHHQRSTWMFGKALQVVRDQRYYREQYGTWTEYLSADVGVSESQAHRLITEWPLAAALDQAAGRPAIQSHVAALAPVASTYGTDAAVTLHHLLTTEAAGRDVRLTAAHVHQAARTVIERAGRRAELPAVQQASEAVAAELPDTDSAPRPSTAASTASSKEDDPVAAVRAALKAQRAVWSALAPAAVEAALAADPAVAKDLDALEVQAGRAAKRARHRPRP